MKWRKRSLVLLCLLSVVTATGAASERESKGKSKPSKVETGVSCKVPAVGLCAACTIVCRPGESVVCAAGVTLGEVCHTQPSCRCTR